MKRLSVFILSLILIFSLAACGKNTPTESEPPAEEKTTLRVGAVTGPQAMGLAKLMYDSDAGTAANSYEFSLDSDAGELAKKLAGGELDIAALPTDTAAGLYETTDGAVQVIAADVLGGLYLAQRGGSVTEISQLRGKTVCVYGQSKLPAYVLKCLLKREGIDPQKDVAIKYCDEISQVMNYISSHKDWLAVLPEPVLTAAQSRESELRVAVNLNEAWKTLSGGSAIVSGAVAVNREFLARYPQQTAKFLEEYTLSQQYLGSDSENAAELIAGYELTATPQTALSAIPGCGAGLVTGEEMEKLVGSFVTELFDLDPKAVGGALPDGDFYGGTQ